MEELRLDDIEVTKFRIIDPNGEYIDIDINSELSINQFNLDSELQKQPQRYVYYTSILEKLKAYSESSELELEKVHATLYEQAVPALQSGGSARPTKDMIEAWIMRQDNYQNALNNVNYYKSLVRKFTYIVKAFEQRKDMLLQISANNRKKEEYEQQIKNIGGN